MRIKHLKKETKPYYLEVNNLTPSKISIIPNILCSTSLLAYVAMRAPKNPPMKKPTAIKPATLISTKPLL